MTRLVLINHSDSTVQSWFPTNIESFQALLAAGSTPRLNHVVGRLSSIDTFNADVFVGLGPHERLVVDLAEATDTEFRLPPPPQCDGWLGGVPVRIAGVKMQRMGTVVNGAAYDTHYQARVGPLLLVHLFLHWYPSQPGWCTGEVMICASNPAVPDMVATIPSGFRLTVGDAIVSVPGLPSFSPLMDEGDWLAHGQTRSLPLTLAWMDLASAQDLATVYAWDNSLISVRGIERLHRDGNPLLPAGFDALAWTNGLLPQVVAKQHDWFDSPLDPAMDSGATGAQGAQSFVGGPAMADDPSGVSVLYIAALDGSWPMVHFEADGSSLDRDAHPQLRLYRGQANTRICTDWLGKPRAATMAEAHGYSGPEDEHWFDFTLFAGARLKGTPALQRLLEAHAANFLFRWVTEPPANWLAPNRAIGWFGMLAGELFRGLADRELAAVVAARFQQVVDQLVIPQMAPNDAWWSWIYNDPRIGASPDDPRAIVWQAEVMAVGMYLGGMGTGHQPSVDLAYHMAEQIIARGWFKDGSGKWISRDLIAQNGADLPYYDTYRHFGFKACDVLLKRDPAHVAAGEIWRQRRAEAEGNLKALAWFVPGIVTTT